MGKLIYVFFGLIASGKSTLAEAWARRLGIRWFNSDVVRKELAGRAAAASGRNEAFLRGLYSEDFTRKTYAALLTRAAAELAQGRSVVLDASYRSQSDRQAVRDLAEKYGATAQFILCSCPEAEARRRLGQRALDPAAVSDGRWEIYLRQKEVFEEPIELAAGELLRLSTVGPAEGLVERLAERVLAERVRDRIGEPAKSLPPK